MVVIMQKEKKRLWWNREGVKSHYGERRTEERPHALIGAGEK